MKLLPQKPKKSQPVTSTQEMKLNKTLAEMPIVISNINDENDNKPQSQPQTPTP